MAADARRDRARPAPVAPETSLGRYRIRELIDEGGMARVYLAHDPELDRLVALKVIENVGIVSNQAREWMLNEARSLARLDHPGIVRVLDVESDGVHDFIVMEHVPGPSLTRVIAEMRRRKEGDTTGDEPPASADVQRAADALETYTARAELLRRIAEALAWCHDRGVLHRDIKPANVLIDDDGSPRLIDFGLAHIAEQVSAVGATSRLYGTAEYVAPEQVDQQRAGADPASDQYSLGVLLFELLTLRSPFQRRTRALTLDAVSRAAPRRPRALEPSVPRDLEAICLHAIERTPEDRYPGVGAMAADLQAWLEQRPIGISATAGRVLRLWLRRNRRRAALAAAGAALLIGALAAQWTLHQRAARTAIRELLAANAPAELEQPEEFMAAFGRLREAGAEARSFDSGWLRAGLLGAQTPVVAQHGEALTRRLSEVLAGVKAERAPSQVDVEMVRWLPALRMDAQLCAEHAFNEEDRLRGQVLLEDGLTPSDVRVLRYEPDASQSAHELVPVPFTRTPSRGTYVVQRLGQESEDPPLQTGLLLTTEAEPVQRISFRAPRPELLARTIPVAAHELSIPPVEGRPPSTVRVPAYRIMAGPVTWGDVRLFAEERWEPGVWELECAALPLEEPALLSWNEAFEFAAWAGMRLPTTLEVVGARDEPGYAFADEMPWQRFQGELVVEPDYEGGRERHMLDYFQLSQGSPFPREWCVVNPPEEKPRGSPTPVRLLADGRKRETMIYAFRLALTR